LTVELLTPAGKSAEETLTVEVLLSVGDSAEEKSAVELLTEFVDPVETLGELLIQVGDQVEGKSDVELLEVAGGSVEGVLIVVLLVCVHDSIQETLAVGSMRLRAVESQIVR